MRKRTLAFALVGAMMLSICGCGTGKADKEDNAGSTEAEAVEEAETQEEQEGTQAGLAEGEEESGENEDTFSFADLKNRDFWFCSGAGAWATVLNVEADGSFYGQYHDSDMGATGEGYPNGSMYLCDFTGRFTEPVRVNAYTYSVQISEMSYEEEPGGEEVKDGILYCYSEPYGLDGAENILIYLPGAPLAELPEEFRSWIGYYDLSSSSDTELPFYALNNEAQQYGFSSYDIVENLRETLSYIESQAVSVENSINNDPLNQTELNEKSQELYEMWDSALNMVWNVLKRTQDEEAMSALTVEEREWIAQKEEAAAEAGAEVEGGSMQPMIINSKAASMTKERVYELMELFE